MLHDLHPMFGIEVCALVTDKMHTSSYVSGRCSTFHGLNVGDPLFLFSNRYAQAAHFHRWQMGLGFWR